jgi:hypothetical protein
MISKEEKNSPSVVSTPSNNGKISINLAKVMVKKHDISNMSQSLLVQEDAVSKSRDPISALFRHILHTKKITNKDFRKAFERYYASDLKKANTYFANKQRDARDPSHDITSNLFFYILTDILGYKVKEISITLSEYDSATKKEKETPYALTFYESGSDNQG